MIILIKGYLKTRKNGQGFEPITKSIKTKLIFKILS